MPYHQALHPLIAWILLVAVSGLAASEARWNWQQPQAEVDPSGDLRWAPEPARFVVGASVRYIDFEAGDDAADGTTRTSAWRHHPWDANASGRAAACRGVHSYVFKRGVVYRGQLDVRDAGTPAERIRLCSDPDWGEGEAVLAGSELVTDLERGRAHPEIPAGQTVWSADLDFLPRRVWLIAADGETIRLPLARTPNWRVEGRDDIKAGWWEWQNRGHGLRHFGNSRTVEGWPRPLNVANDPAHLTPELLAAAEGAYVWSEYGWVMGTPFPSRIRGTFPEEGGIAFGGQWGDNAGSHIIRGNRYYLEDAPAFLDDPDGEFWFDRRGEGGTLHLILPRDLAPGDVRIEAARHEHLIDAGVLEHVEIADLTFRFTNRGWALDAGGGAGSAIRQVGSARDLSVRHCRFVDVDRALAMHAAGSDDLIEDVRFTDNDLLRTDEGGVAIRSGGGWGLPAGPFGQVREIEILRNRLRFIGMRPSRHGQGHALHLEVVRSAHVAGNILDMCWAAGIFVFGGKNAFSDEDVPFTRLLIHHNKVTNALLNSNDWGGIETWQGGPAYVFDNVVGDVRGYWHYQIVTPTSDTNSNASFGHAYYLDGAFKNYHFNNIAYGRTRDWHSPLWTCSAFQEIHSYQNTFFNNTAVDVNAGSRRQAPRAGRNKYLGNLFDGVQTAFRHADGVSKEANADHAGEQGDGFAYDTNAYGSNVFHTVEHFGLFEEDGTRHRSLDDFAAALERRRALRSDLGRMLENPPLPRRADHDFTPTPELDGMGVRVFVPWALSRCVGEWHFTPSRRDGRVIDEHWDMPEYACGRQTYHELPSFPLHPAGGLGIEHAVAGELEDWTAGALALDGTGHYLRAEHATMVEPISYELHHRAGPKRGKREQRTVTGAGLKNPQVHDSNLLIEVYAKVAPGGAGLVVGKLDAEAGYALEVADGRARLRLRHAGEDVVLTGVEPIADGRWHHLVAEVDREARTMRLYRDGALDSEGPGLGPVSLANGSDLYVGGRPEGEHLAVTLDFLRICLGTLAEAKTDIDELRAWQFAGPQLRDFAGREPTGLGRDAGAIEGR